MKSKVLMGHKSSINPDLDICMNTEDNSPSLNNTISESFVPELKLIPTSEVSSKQQMIHAIIQNDNNYNNMEIIQNPLNEQSENTEEARMIKIIEMADQRPTDGSNIEQTQPHMISERPYEESKQMAQAPI